MAGYACSVLARGNLRFSLYSHPFGVHDVERDPRRTGDVVIKTGNSVTFRYRFLLHAGNSETVKVEPRWNDRAKAKEPATRADSP